MTKTERAAAPPCLREFLNYHETIAGHSPATVSEYFHDLRKFFRFLLQNRGDTAPFGDISIAAVDLPLLQSVTMADIYDYMQFLAEEPPKHWRSRTGDNGLESVSRARKLASIRSFFKFLHSKSAMFRIEVNPVADMESPKFRKRLPRYLSETEAVDLLGAVESRRDYAILTLFLNCGLRRGELVGLDLADFRRDKDPYLRIHGKGNKERIVFLNAACLAALEGYLAERADVPNDPALFLSARDRRMHPNTVHALVKKHLLAAGIDPNRYSTHKLRHTAATLMLQNGVDVRTLQEVLGHERLDTTQIYAHVGTDQLKQAAHANPLSKLTMDNG